MKVMIVDDEKPIRQWFAFILRDIPDMEIEIIGSYPNGQLALEACAEELPDVIFCDIIMPVMNGLELIRQVKECYPQVEVLILSNFDDFDYVYQGLRCGAYDYLLKAKSDDADIIKLMHKLEAEFALRHTVAPPAPEETARYTKEIVNRLTAYLHENYAQPIRLSALAQEFNYNSDYLSQIFKQETGENFAAYLTNVRIEKAKELLQDGSSRIKDIALAVGYSNEMYFSTAFKKCTGLSPSQFLRASALKPKDSIKN